jgi:hypothetical protein
MASRPSRSSDSSNLVESGANIASAAKDHAKTFASELENLGRRNPLGASWIVEGKRCNIGPVAA